MAADVRVRAGQIWDRIKDGQRVTVVFVDHDSGDCTYLKPGEGGKPHYIFEWNLRRLYRLVSEPKEDR